VVLLIESLSRRMGRKAHPRQEAFLEIRDNNKQGSPFFQNQVYLHRDSISWKQLNRERMSQGAQLANNGSALLY